jgi:drug/metabolite transporter (DMT)-like permease
VSNASLLQPRVLIPFTVATLIWGTTWIVIRDQLGAVPPTWSVTYRFGVAAIAMFGYALFIRAPLTLGRGGQIFAALLGFVQFVLNFNFVYRAEQYITSGLVAVLFALLIIPNAVFGRIFLNTAISKRFLAGSVIAMIGVAMLILQEIRADASSADATILGAMLTIAGVLSASVANVMQGASRARAMPMASMLAWGMVWGTAINALFGWMIVGPPVMIWEPRYIAGILYLGVFASAIAFTCYFSVIRSIGPAKAAYSSVMTPILAMIISTFVEDYRWSALAAIGGIAAMAGLLVALSAPKPVTKSG